MAEAIRFVCEQCQHSLTAWSDGNPFYLDAAGAKHYAYHPNHEGLAKCIGNDSPFLCLACGAEFTVDSRHPSSACPNCQAVETSDLYQLEGKMCPFCKNGVFQADSNFHCIS